MLSENSDYRKDFAGGVFTHSYLDVNDYHRYHFPVGSTIKEIQIIEGDDASGGLVEWDTVQGRYEFTSEIPGW